MNQENQAVLPSNLNEWLSYLESLHVSEIDMGLSRVRKVWLSLGTSVNNQTIVTVAGTNGKGTTTACIAGLLRSADCSVGVYSSPHLHSFNERITINSRMANDEEICRVFKRIEVARQSTSLTYFEFATLAALLLFIEHSVDYILLEVGLGGRLDATNIVDADVAVITSIGYDHQQYLGETLPEIAFEKAGIIKTTSDVVLGIKPDSFGLAFDRDVNKQMSIVPAISSINHGASQITLFNKLDNGLPDILAYKVKNRHLPLQNALVAIACLLHLEKKATNQNILTLFTEKHRIEEVLSEVRLPGRYQFYSEQPRIIMDVAHNAQAAEYLYNQLKEERFRRIYLVVGMLRDKNIEASLFELLKLNADWLCCDINGSRGEKATRMARFLADNKQSNTSFISIEKGLQYAIKHAGLNDVICVFGSFVTIAQATNTLEKLQSK